MRRIMRIWVMLCAGVLLFAACSSAPSSQVSETGQIPVMSAGEAPATGAQIAFLITEQQRDEPFIQSVYSAISRFSGEENTTSGTYKTEENSANAALSTLELAVTGGAELVVAVGEDMSRLLAQGRGRYSDIDFIFIDNQQPTAPPANSTYLQFSPVQAGWLAGYAAVGDGATRLSFQLARDALSQSYAVGFLLGAEAAAGAYGAEASVLPLVTLGDTPEDTSLATQQSQWLEAFFAEDYGVLFANDVTRQQDLFRSARLAGARVIGVGPELAQAYGIVLSVTQKNPGGGLYDLLTLWREGDFPGGETTTAGVADGGVSLAMDSADFSRFSDARYQAALSQFDDGSLARRLDRALYSGESGGMPAPEELPLEHLTFWAPEPDPADSSLSTSQTSEISEASDTSGSQEAPGDTTDTSDSSTSE